MGRVGGGLSYLVAEPPHRVSPRCPWGWGWGLLGSRRGGVVLRGMERPSPCRPTAWLFRPEAMGFLVRVSESPSVRLCAVRVHTEALCELQRSAAEPLLSIRTRLL